MNSDPQFLQLPDGSRRAYDRLAAPPGAPGVVFLHGLMSDRGGTKAQALRAHCSTRGYGFVSFDMFGHGASSGRFEDGTISRWTQDAIAVLDALTLGPQILVGSSMGGWVMVKTAVGRAPRIGGLVGIAVAPDFTEDLLAALNDDQRALLRSEGIVPVQSDYDTRPYPISRALIDDGRANMVLARAVAITAPVRLLHGQQDTSVDWRKSVTLAEKIEGSDVEVVLIKDGDHRLSRPQDLRKLCATVDELVAKVRP